MKKYKIGLDTVNVKQKVKTMMIFQKFVLSL